MMHPISYDPGSIFISGCAGALLSALLFGMFGKPGAGVHLESVPAALLYLMLGGYFAVFVANAAETRTAFMFGLSLDLVARTIRSRVSASFDAKEGEE